MDINQMSDEELLKAYSSVKNKTQQAEEAYKASISQSPEALAEAKRLTGLDQDGAVKRFGLGVAKNVADIGTLAQQGVTALTGTEEESRKLREKVDEDRALFSKYAGTAGTVGEFVGGAAVGFVPGVGAANILSKSNKALRMLGTGAAAGAAGGAAQPLGVDDSVAANAALGATIGAATAGTIGGGAKAIQAIVNRTKKSKSERVLSDAIAKEVGTMSPEQVDKFGATLSKLEKGEGLRKLTPAQVINRPSAYALEEELINSKPAILRLKDIAANNIEQEVSAMRKLADAVPNSETVRKLSPSTLVANYEAKVANQIRRDALPYYEALNKATVAPPVQRTLLRDPTILKSIKQAAENPEVAMDTRVRLRKVLEQNSTRAQGPGASGILDETGSPYAASPQAFKPVDVTLGDLNEVYKVANTRWFRSGSKNKEAETVRNRLRQQLEQNEDWRAANEIYVKGFEPQKELYASRIAKQFRDKPDSIFNVRNQEKAATLADWMDRNAPEVLNDLSSNRLVTLLNTIGTKHQPRDLVEQLDRIAMLNRNNPVNQRIIATVREALETPQLKVQQKIHSGTGEIFTLYPQGGGAVGVSIRPQTLLNRLRSQKYQIALVELMTNPVKWAPLARKAIAQRKGEGLVDLLDVVLTGMSSAHAAALDLPA